jgi:hypothetical protein
MAILINGKEMKDAVIKTENYEMRILQLTPDLMRVSIKDIYGEAFNFVPRLVTIVYPDTKNISARDSGIIVVPRRETVQATVQFAEKLRLERMMSFEFRYARKKLADISIE